MNKMLSVVYYIPVMFVVVLIYVVYQYSVMNTEEFNSVVLSHAVTHASDAAIEELLESDNLGTDYSKMGVDVSPIVALDTFVDTLLLSYDIEPTDDMRDKIKQENIPAFVVTAYDGYYIAELRDVTKGDEGTFRDLVFSPKIPYSYESGGKTYSLNFGLRSSIVVENGSITKTDKLPEGLRNEDEVLRQINTVLLNAVAYAIDKRNEEDSRLSSEQSFFIPNSLTSVTKTNQMKGVGVIAVVQNISFNFVKSVSAYTVGSNEITNRRYIVGYVKDGVKKYGYADNIDESIVKADGSQVFLSTKDAADHGYFPELKELR